MFSDTSTQTISVKDLVAMSGLSKTTIFKLIAEHRLQTTKVGRRRLISLASAQALLRPDMGGEAV